MDEYGVPHLELGGLQFHKQRQSGDGRTSFPSFLSRCQESAPRLPLHWVVEFSCAHMVKLRLLTVVAQWK